MRDERPQQSGVPRSPHSASPTTAPGTGSAARHQARYNADGSPPPCRTTYRAHARTTPDRSPRNPSARSTRPAARNAVTPLARARGFRAPSNGSSTSSWPPVFATAASAASAHRFCTRVSVSRAAARASWAGERRPSSTARRWTKRRTARSGWTKRGANCSGTPTAELRRPTRWRRRPAPAARRAEPAARARQRCRCRLPHGATPAPAPALARPSRHTARRPTAATPGTRRPVEARPRGSARHDDTARQQAEAQRARQTRTARAARPRPAGSTRADPRN